MEQDELEDEVFTKTIVTHFGLISKFLISSNWAALFYCREAFCIFAVCFAVVIWLIHSSRNYFGFFWTALPMAGLAGLDSGGGDSEDQLGESAVYALKGRRSTMEDRFVLLKIEPEMENGGGVVVLNAILDGHGGEYAANYVKKHLIESLVNKIKLLKILANSSTNKNAEKIRLFEKVSQTQMTKTILDFLGVSLADYKKLNPHGSLQMNGTNCDETKTLKREDPKPVTINSNLVLSSRVKPIEELPVAAKSVDNETESESMCDNMLSPYNNVQNSKDKLRRNSKSPAKNQEPEQPKEKEVTDYLNGKSEILYADLLKDEIAKVDKLLLKDSKKVGQIGGTTLLMTILDERTLWVANVGDSRGVLYNSRGDTIPLSYDHKPCQLKEKKRIQDAGGFVSMNGVWRVQGVLATSRALGDYPLKDRKVVVSEPDVLSFKLSSEPHLRPEFAVLASDGLWDIFSNEEATAFTKRHLISFGGSKSEKEAAKSLAKEAYSKGSTDNVTVMIINLKKMFVR